MGNKNNTEPKKKGFMKRVIRGYSHFLTKFPAFVILIVMVISAGSIYYSSTIKNKSLQYRGMLPDTVEVIMANNMFTDSFGGSDSAKFVIQVDNSYPKSTEIRDVRDPRVLTYASLLEEYASSSSEITQVMSATETLRLMNNGTLPKDKNRIISLIKENPLLDSYFSEDGTMMIINFKLRDDYDEDKVVEDLEEAINSIEIPAGVRIDVGGDSITGVYVNNQMGNDMSKTSSISMIGIILLLIVTFWSLKYAFLPLTTIIFGVLWAFGFIGMLGLEMSSATSGVISMIMGIGIDFGIQIITRFRQEYSEEKYSNLEIDEKIETVMSQSMQEVIMPMFTTTLAAIIGFKAMSMGQLTIMREMGDMMTYGVVFCFLAAITFVPAITIIVERISFRIHHKMKSLSKTDKKTRNNDKSRRSKK